MKRLLFVVSLISATISLWAGNVTLEQALSRARQFMAKQGRSTALVQAKTSLATRSGEADAYYVFNAGDGQGFVIMSGDDRAVQVLGYSEHGAFDVSNVPANMAVWLEGYANQINYVRTRGSVQGAGKVARANYVSVEPIVKVHWDQNDPYNKYCYMDLVGGRYQAPTGCVATAMAQAMSVERYPTATTAEIPAYSVNFGADGIACYEAIPSGTKIDWDNLDVENFAYWGNEPEEKKEAIARLMSYCGRSVEMTYNGTASSAQVSKVAEALKTYFGYAPQVAYKKRDWNSDENWEAIIYNEVASGRPVVYGGQTAGNQGHAFIVDGYDNGLFHINWGWGQLGSYSPDGYYALSALDPKTEGTGGADGAYNFGQEAVIGITSRSNGPISEDVKATLYDVKVGELKVDAYGYLVAPDQTEYTADRKSGGVSLALLMTYTNRLINVYNFDLGYGVLDKNGKLVGNVNTFSESTRIHHNEYQTRGTGSSGFFRGYNDGTYYIKAYSRQSGSSEWKLCDDADKMAIEVVVSKSSISFRVVDLTSGSAPEVSDVQREALADSYAVLESLLASKQVVLAESRKALDDLKGNLAELLANADKLNAELKATEETLGNELLSDDQKSEFGYRLNELAAALKSNSDDLEDVNSKIAELEKLFATAADAQSKAASDIASGKARVNAINTAKALDDAKAKAQEIQASLEAFDKDAVDKNVDDYTQQLAAAQGDIDKTKAAEDALNVEVARAIEAAQKAKEEFDNAKSIAQAEIDMLKKQLDDDKAQIEAEAQNLAGLQKVVSDNEEQLATLKALAAKIQTMLDDNALARRRGLSDEQKADYQARLDDLNEQIAPLEEWQEENKSNIENISQLISNLQVKVDNLEKDVLDVEVHLTEATTIDEVNALQSALDNLKKDADIEANMSEVKNLISYLQRMSDVLTESLNGTKSSADQLATEIEEAISGISGVTLDERDASGRYDMQGRKVNAQHKGLTIIRQSNGKAKKVMSK